MTNTPEEIFNVMNASNILVAILSKLKQVDISAKDFLESNSTDKQLSVTYNDSISSFEFKLREEGEQENDSATSD